MGDKSAIEWTGATWTPIRARVKLDAAAIAEAKGYTSLVEIGKTMAGRVGPHCERVSPGCEHCYSETNNSRCLPNNGTGLPFDRRARELVDVFLDEKILMQPLRWRAPKKIFVCSQTDLFGEWVPDEVIDRVFAVMALTPWHTYQVLTKRADRMSEYFRRYPLGNDMYEIKGAELRVFRTMVEALKDTPANVLNRAAEWQDEHFPNGDGFLRAWPLPNVWLGVSVEDQKRADERVPLLLQTPAAVRWLSVEPLLGPVELDNYLKVCKHWKSADSMPSAPWHPPYPKHWYQGQALVLAGWKCPIDWIVVGGESGLGARPMHPDWARSLRDQCAAAGVPFLFKQWGEWCPATEEYGVTGSIMPDTGDRYKWIGFDGTTQNPSSHGLCDPIMAIARQGKKAAGRILDGVLHDAYPEVRS